MMTIFVTLGIWCFLAVPVSALAGEPTKIGDSSNECLMWNDKDNGIQVEGKGCQPYLQKPGCYQKMREAMKDAEKNNFWPVISVIGEDYEWPQVGIADYGCDELCRAKKRVQELEDKRKKNDAMLEARKRWNATMRECVK